VGVGWLHVGRFVPPAQRLQRGRRGRGGGGGGGGGGGEGLVVRPVQTIPPPYRAGNGGLGHGNNVTQPRPALVETLADSGVRIVSVAAGVGHMFALSAGGVVFSWGNGEYGRCGNGKSKQLVPEPVTLLQGKRVVSIASGTSHGLAVTSDGVVWGWGKNDAGQVGVGGSVLMDLNTHEEYPLAAEPEADDGDRFRELAWGRGGGGRGARCLRLQNAFREPHLATQRARWWLCQRAARGPWH
jgi:hypothetical protein